MLLRKLTAAFGPLLLCVAVCAVFRWLDGLLAAGLFWSFLLKGAALGAALALALPLAGVKLFTNGLTPWLLAGAGLLLCVLALQYLQTVGLLHSQLLLTLFTINGQVVLVESAMMGFMTLSALRRY